MIKIIIDCGLYEFSFDSINEKELFLLEFGNKVYNNRLQRELLLNNYSIKGQPYYKNMVANKTCFCKTPLEVLTINNFIYDVSTDIVYDKNYFKYSTTDKIIVGAYLPYFAYVDNKIKRIEFIFDNSKMVSKVLSYELWEVK